MYVQIIFFKNRKCFHENHGLSRYTWRIKFYLATRER
jgi:hypothetical protein